MKETFILDDKVWEQLIELTDGAAAVCFQCGVCTAICPWGLVKGETISVRNFMRQAQLGLQDGNENLWLCTTCAQCEAYCPRGVNIADVFLGLRYLAWQRNQPEAGLPTLLWSVYWNNNPWEQPPSQRSQWAKNLDLSVFDPEQHEILYYVGCTTSYDRRAQKIALSLIKLFEEAGVRFGILGDDEPCSGEEVLSVGHKHYFQEIIQRSSQVFQDRGVTKLVTTSPHSFDVFYNHYPIFNEDFRPLHYAQYLAELLEESRLKFTNPVERKVTFQDPCYLARHNGELDAPRKVIEAIPGIEFVEMENHGIDTLCCGGGGGRMWLETAPGERFSDLRVKEVLETGADALITSCPYCVSCLEDSIKAQNIQEVEVMDVAELAVLAVSE